MMMMMMIMMMCKRLAQVPRLCVPIYNIKLAMMQKTPIFTTFSAHTKMTAEKRGQNEVFARNSTISCSYFIAPWKIVKALSYPQLMIHVNHPAFLLIM